MQTTLSRWGNSLAVRLPKAAVDSLRLVEGAPLDVTVSEGRIEIVSAGPTPESFLAELQRAVTAGLSAEPEDDWETAPPAGSEVW